MATVFQSIIQCRQYRTMLNNGASRALLLLVVVVWCSFYQNIFPELIKFAACFFNEIVISKCLPMTIVCKNGSVEGLPVDTVVREENCKIIPLSFQWLFHQQNLLLLWMELNKTEDNSVGYKWKWTSRHKGSCRHLAKRLICWAHISEYILQECIGFSWSSNI
jgi:hypothetical protein